MILEYKLLHKIVSKSNIYSQYIIQYTLHVCMLINILCVYHDVCSYHEHEETWDIRNIVDVYTSLVTVKYSFIQGKYLYFPYYMYGLKHCRECYMENMERKEWARDKYSTRRSQVLYFVSRPLFEFHIFHISTS